MRQCYRTEKVRLCTRYRVLYSHRHQRRDSDAAQHCLSPRRSHPAAAAPQDIQYAYTHIYIHIYIYIAYILHSSSRPVASLLKLLHARALTACNRHCRASHACLTVARCQQLADSKICHVVRHFTISIHYIPAGREAHVRRGRRQAPVHVWQQALLHFFAAVRPRAALQQSQHAAMNARRLPQSMCCLSRDLRALSWRASQRQRRASAIIGGRLAPIEARCAVRSVHMAWSRSHA